MMRIHCFVLWLMYLDGYFSADLTDVENLYSTLLTNYNKDVRPLTTTDAPVYVNGTFNLVGLKEFDEVNGKFSLIGFFTFTWVDSRLSWDPSSHNSIFTIELPETKVWVPNLMIGNPYDKIGTLGKGILPVTYVYNGLAYWSPGDVISSGCEVDVTYYPFDTQNCNVMFMCWGYTPEAVITTAQTPEIKTAYFSEHGTWDIIEKELKSHLDSTMSYISVDIKMKRRPAFAVINIVLPMVFMVILNLLVFILPVDSGERVSYSITVLLAIAVFLTLVGDNLPKTSTPTALLSYFLLGDLILSSVICLIVILGLTFHHRDDSESPVPNRVARAVKFCCYRKVCRFKNKTAVEAFNENAGKKSKIPDDDDDDDDDIVVTWKMVSKCFDKFMLMFSLLAITIQTVLFFVMTMQ